MGKIAVFVHVHVNVCERVCVKENPHVWPPSISHSKRTSGHSLGIKHESKKRRRARIRRGGEHRVERRLGPSHSSLQHVQILLSSLLLIISGRKGPMHWHSTESWRVVTAQGLQHQDDCSGRPVKSNKEWTQSPELFQVSKWFSLCAAWLHPDPHTYCANWHLTHHAHSVFSSNKQLHNAHYHLKPTEL